MVLSCLTVVLLFSGIFSGTAVFASENVVVQQKGNRMPVNSILIKSSIESVDGEISTASAPTYISKKALKWAINNTTTITNLVGKYFGKTAAKNVGNVIHTYVKPVLRKLEALDNVTYGKLEETLYNAMKMPLGAAAARIGAKAIVEIIEIFAPI